MKENTKKSVIKVEGKKWADAIDKAVDNAIKKVKIDGFRPGHAPREVFLNKYGKKSVLMDAADLCLQDAYTEMLEVNKDIEIVSQPDMVVKSIDEKGLELEFTLTLKPAVKLGKYTGLNVKKDEVKVTKKEIDESIKQMQSRYAENVEKEGKVVSGDVAVIDFEGFKDGVAFEGGKGTNYSLTIGSNTFIPGFEDQIIGMAKGETKDVNVTFPKDYQEKSLAGAPVVFKVTVNAIKTIVIPELNKDFFDDLGMEGIDTKEKLEAQVKENLETRKEADAENKYMDDLLDAAAKNTTVDIPDAMIKEESHRMVHQYEENLKMQGLTLEQFYQFTHSNEQALMDEMSTEAGKRVKYRLMLEEISKAEKINPTEKEVDKEAETLATKYQMKKDEFLKEFGGLEMVKYDMQMRAAMETLKKD